MNPAQSISLRQMGRCLSNASPEVSEYFHAYRESGNDLMNRMLLPLILLTPDSTPRFYSQLQLYRPLPVVDFCPSVD